MSRLLALLPSVPEPADSGARLRNRGLLGLLGNEHTVDAVAFGQSSELARLQALVNRASVLPMPAPRSSVARARSLLTSRWPDLAERLWSPGFARAVQAMLSDGEYAAVQAEGIEMARYLRLVEPARRVYDAHNAEFLLQRRLAETAISPGARLYSTVQWRRLARLERDVVRGSRVTLAVSEHDANQLLALAGGDARVVVVPNAIDAAAYPFCPDRPRAVSAAEVLFLGKLDFRPNAEGVRWFLDQVMPRVPGLRLFAVGAAPPRWLVECGQHDPHVAVTGYVPNERPYLARCAALVLPLRTAGGSRLKALVAMASGVPVVSTRIGMEGLEAEPDVHFLRADAPGEWATALKRLLTDAGLRERLARAGRALVERRYDWSARAAEVRAAYAWLRP